MRETSETKFGGYREHPMTDIQAAYWVGRRDDIDRGGFSTHIYEEIESIGLDLDRFERSWNRIIARHETLRTVVSSEGRVRILEACPHHTIPHDDLRGLTRAEQEARIETIRERHRQEVLPSDTWPLRRVRTAQLTDRIRRKIPGLEVISMGGATEAATWSVIHHVGAVDPSWRSIPYGRAMRNQTIEVRDESLHRCPPGEIGEIFIGGVGLARGYWRDEALTSASFVNSPEGRRLYRTGDLGRYDGVGRIEFLGRIDHQVKVRGFRIEIGEIEHAILEHPAVAKCVVKAAGPPCGERRLVACLVAASTAPEGDLDAIRSHVAARLPEHMVPSNWHWMLDLPLNANGKVDRTADLDALISEWSITPEDAGRETRTTSAGHPSATAPRAREIAAIAAEVLAVPEVTADTDLVELGANSVDVIRIANRIETTLGAVRPPLDGIYDDPTPSGIARLLGPSEPAAESSSTPAASHDDLEVLRDPADRQAFRQARKGRRQDADTLDDIELARDPDADSVRRRNHRRRSHRVFDQNPLELDRLGRVLEALADSGEERLKFRYGSAGGLYPVQTYLIARPGRITGLDRGVYYLDQYEHRLRRIGDDTGFGPELYDRFVNGPIVRSCAFALMSALHADTIEPMYGARSHEYALIEAGLMAQLLESEGPREGIGFTQIGSMDDGPLHAPLKLDERDRIVYSMLGGSIPTGDPPRFPTWREGRL